MLTATFNSYGDRQISTPTKSITPEPIDKKFRTIDYVREGTHAMMRTGGTGPPNVNLGPDKISETTRARMLKIKNTIRAFNRKNFINRLVEQGVD